MIKKHRDSQKRRYFEDAVYFVTFYPKHRLAYFKEQVFCDLFVENLRICKKLKGFYLYGWVLIYNHLHLLMRPNDEYNISKVVFSLKKQFSHDVNRVIGYNQKYPDSPTPKTRKRLRAFGERDIDLFSTIAKHQKIVNRLKTQFHKKHPNQNQYPRFQWQKSFHNHYIRNDSDFDYHMEYIIWNPQKHNMPDDWPYIFTNPIYANLVNGIY